MFSAASTSTRSNLSSFLIKLWAAALFFFLELVDQDFCVLDVFLLVLGGLLLTHSFFLKPGTPNMGL